MRKIATLFFSCLTLAVFAQGSGADGALTVSAAGTTIDGTKSQLNGNASSGQATVTVENSTGFATNQVCFLVQMRGTGAGNYEEKTISSISGNNITFSSNLTYTYTDDGTAANANNMAQLIKMPQYTSVTINAGSSLTCSAWNGTVGGIVCFLASGTVTVNSTAGGGIFATAKGGVAGSAGTGGVGAGDGDGGGWGPTSPPGDGQDADANMGTSGCSGASWSGGRAAGLAGTTGSSGGAAIVYSSAGGTISSGTAATNNSNNANWRSGQGQSLLMGGGGAGGAGGNSGKSGGGGGGDSGGMHGSRADGGNGGAGGNGGGIIYFRCSALAGAGDIIASGANGSNGGNGYSGCGGEGSSNGAAGGDGSNGNGGNGGGGGAQGSIFILKASTTHSGSITAAAGAAGSGGTQGAAGAKGNMAQCASPLCGSITAGSNGSAGTAATSSAITTSNETLPVKYLYFYGVNNQDVNKLFWSTASEINSDFFEVQRSIDGIHFEKFDEITSAGTSNTTHNYSCLDDNPNKITYYRLKQIDKDGKHEFSTIISILKSNNIQTSFFSVRPNPASDQIEISVGSKEEKNVRININDADGRLLWHQSFILYQGNNSIPINLVSFPSGTYVVSIEDRDGYTRTARFIKK